MLRKFVGTAALALLGSLGAGSNAQAVTITLGACYTGGCSDLVGTIAIEITADTLAQNSGVGDVKFVITNNTNGFIDELGVRYTGGLPAGTAIENFTVPVGNVSLPSLSFGPTQNDNSNQSLNLGFDYQNSNSGGGRFNAGEQVQFFLDSESADILVALFANAGFAHVQGLPGNPSSARITACQAPDANCDGQPPVPVPEPTTLALFGLGLLGAGFARRRRS